MCNNKMVSACDMPCSCNNTSVGGTNARKTPHLHNPPRNNAAVLCLTRGMPCKSKKEAGLHGKPHLLNAKNLWPLQFLVH
jgi:hypothetical protein